MALHIGICDDEPDQAEYVRRMVAAWAAEGGRKVTTTLFGGAEELLFALEDVAPFHILLLDIQMGGMDGMEMARRLRARGEGMEIVFITGFPDFAAEGYEVGALHYLMKPVSPEKLGAVLDRAARQLEKARLPLVFDTPEGPLRLFEDELLYVEAFAHTVELHLSDRVHSLRLPISRLEAMLSGAFVRCHRSYLVNLDAVRTISKAAVLLDDGREVPLSRRLADPVNKAFLDHYRR